MARVELALSASQKDDLGLDQVAIRQAIIGIRLIQIRITTGGLSPRNYGLRRPSSELARYSFSRCINQSPEGTLSSLSHSM